MLYMYMYMSVMCWLITVQFCIQCTNFYTICFTVHILYNMHKLFAHVDPVCPSVYMFQLENRRKELWLNLTLYLICICIKIDFVEVCFYQGLNLAQHCVNLKMRVSHKSCLSKLVTVAPKIVLCIVNICWSC